MFGLSDHLFRLKKTISYKGSDRDIEYYIEKGQFASTCVDISFVVLFFCGQLVSTLTKSSKTVVPFYDLYVQDKGKTFIQ